MDDQIFIPLRFALEALLYEVVWPPDNSKDGIQINGYGNSLMLYPNNKVALLNGQTTTLSAGAVIKDNVSYICTKDLEVLNVHVSVNNGKIRLEN